MLNQILTHNVKPIALTAKTVVCPTALWSAIKTSADLRLCHYRMSKREGCGLVGGFST